MPCRGLVQQDCLQNLFFDDDFHLYAGRHCLSLRLSLMQLQSRLQKKDKRSLTQPVEKTSFSCLLPYAKILVKKFFLFFQGHPDVLRIVIQIRNDLRLPADKAPWDRWTVQRPICFARETPQCCRHASTGRVRYIGICA